MGNRFCCPDRDENVSEGTILFSSDDVLLPPKNSGANWFQGPSPPASPITHATRELNKAAAEEERLASGWFQRQAAAAKADREAATARERQDTRDRAEEADKHAAELKAAAKVAAMQAEFHKDGWFSAAPSPHKQQTEEEKAGECQQALEAQNATNEAIKKAEELGAAAKVAELQANFHKQGWFSPSPTRAMRPEAFSLHSLIGTATGGQLSLLALKSCSTFC